MRIQRVNQSYKTKYLSYNKDKQTWSKCQVKLLGQSIKSRQLNLHFQDQLVSNQLDSSCRASKVILGFKNWICVNALLMMKTWNELLADLLKIEESKLFYSDKTNSVVLLHLFRCSDLKATNTKNLICLIVELIRIQLKVELLRPWGR